MCSTACETVRTSGWEAVPEWEWGSLNPGAWPRVLTADLLLDRVDAVSCRKAHGPVACLGCKEVCYRIAQYE